jgi:hypothetical protein
MTTTAQNLFELTYQDSPIFLNNGIAQFLPGNTMPISLFTQLLNLPIEQNGGLFAQYKPLSGGSLASWQIAEYPFLNLQMAANAVIQMPLNISMLMICPAQTNGGYPIKISILTALQNAIQNHILQGGSFTVLTPAYAYENCLLTGIKDVTPPSDKQVQYLFQWDFTQPLITETGAVQTLGTFMNRVQSGSQTTVTWNNTPAVGVNPYDPNGYVGANGENIGT